MMAEPSPPSEQTSILDLSYIATAISPDLASDFARLADFPVPVPELAPVVEPLKRIEAWSREQTSHRDSCRNLLHDALKLVVLISERSQDGPTDSSELSPAIEQTVASILDINDHIDIWAHIPRRMSSRWQPTIEATITEHEEHLKNFLDHLSGEVTLPEYDDTATSEWKVQEEPVDHWVPSEDMEEPVHGDSQPGLSGVVEKSLTSEVPETPDDQPPVLSHSLNPTSQGHENLIPSIDALQLDHPVDEGSSNASDMDKWAKFVTVVPGQHGRFKMKTGSSPIYGGFSDVWECDAKFSDGSIIAVAVKKFRAVRIDRDADENTVHGKLLKRLTKELEIWMGLKHRNITPLLGFVLLGDLCMISPWYSNGNVASYIIQHPETDRIKLVSDVACGLAYLHNRALPVIHGDMKPDNVLIDETGDAVIIDFGLSSVIEDEPTLATSFTSASLQDAGNARWMAPELLMETGCTRSLSTDIYSFGCVALFIYTGEIPFKGIPYIQIIYALIQGQKPVANRSDYPAISGSNVEWFYRLLVSCWDAEPSSRPSIGTVEEQMRSGDGTESQVSARSAPNPSWGKVTSIVKLFDIPVLVSAGIVFDVARLAACCAPVPGLAPVVETVRSIYASVERLSWNKSRCRKLSTKAMVLIFILCDSYGNERAEISKLKTAIEKTVQAMHDIDVDFREWAASSFWRNWYLRHEVDLRITEHEENLKSLTEYISLAATVQIHDKVAALQESLKNNPSGSADRKRAEEQLYRLRNACPGELAALTPPELTCECIRLGNQPEFSGTRSEVWRGRWLDKQDVALLFYKEYEMEAGADDGIRRLEREIKVWRRLDNPYVLRLYGWCKFDGETYLVSPWLRNGDVLKYLEGDQDRHKKCLALITEIALGLRYLHNRDIIHGSLKPSNILVQDNGRAILSGFSLAKLSTPRWQDTKIDPPQVNTLRYQAPEVILEKPISKAADVYSWTMTALEIITGDPPFHTWKSPEQLIAQVIMQSQIPNRSDYKSPVLDKHPEIWNLFVRSWNRQQAERPTAKEIVEVLESIPANAEY